MAVSKPLRKNFYSDGSAGTIEMPPLDQVPPVMQDQSHNAQQSSNQEQAISVPDELPLDVEQEVVSLRNNDQEEEQEPEENIKPRTVQQKQSSREENFRNIREAKEKAERERDALLAQMLEMQKYQRQQQPIQQEPEMESVPDFDFSVEDDALIEGKHVKKLVQRLKYMDKRFDDYQKQSYTHSVESRIKSDFPDFDKVVSPDNVQIINEEFPELAQTLRDEPDKYKQAASVYKVIKRTGIYQDKGEFMPEKQKAEYNLKKPKSTATVAPQQGDSPLSKANAFGNGLTPELQRQLREEMFKSRRNY